MARARSFTTPWITLTANVADPSDNGFSPVGNYMRSGPLEKARMSIETRNRVGAIEIIGAVNFAQSQLAPLTNATNLGSTWIDSATLTNPSAFTDLSGTSEDYQLARFGFVTRLESGQSGTALIEARAKVDILWNYDMQNIVVPFSTVYAASTSARWFPMTGWYNGAEVVRARGPFEVQANSGTLDFAWGYQVTNDPTNPGTSATMIGGGYTSDPSTVTYPSGFTTIDTSDDQLIRFGWLVKRTSGTGIAMASIGGELEFGRT